MRILTFLFICLMLGACRHSEPEKARAVMNMAMLPPPPSENKMAEADLNIPTKAGNQNAGADTEKKVIKTGELNFEVANLDKARQKILKSVKTLNGYVAEENQSNEDNKREEYELKLRVPAKNFDRLLDSVCSGASRIDLKDISVKDVTTDFIDVKAQLANSKVLEDTYLGLLKKATRMSDVLLIESKVTEIRTQIDSTQGVLNYLSRQTELATLDLTFYTKQFAPKNDNSAWSQFIGAIGDGWGLLQNILFGLISVWPLIPLVPVGYFAFRRWRRLRKATAQPVSS